jgi:hypothetical protein
MPARPTRARVTARPGDWGRTLHKRSKRTPNIPAEGGRVRQQSGKDRDRAEEGSADSGVGVGPAIAMQPSAPFPPRRARGQGIVLGWTSVGHTHTHTHTQCAEALQLGRGHCMETRPSGGAGGSLALAHRSLHARVGAARAAGRATQERAQRLRSARDGPTGPQSGVAQGPRPPVPPSEFSEEPPPVRRCRATPCSHMDGGGGSTRMRVK